MSLVGLTRIILQISLPSMDELSGDRRSHLTLIPVYVPVIGSTCMLKILFVCICVKHVTGFFRVAPCMN